LSGIFRACTPVDDLTLTKDCEQGFRRFVEMAQNGRFGSDVEDVNVGISAKQVQIELVRRDAPSKHFLLSAKRSTHSISRYFDVVPGEGSTVADAEQIGRALDEVFLESPFVLPAISRPRNAAPASGTAGTWSSDSWMGLLHGAAWRMMGPASLEYTVGIIVALVLGLLATLVFLWTAQPPPRR
jgi:hypothetical protein